MIKKIIGFYAITAIFVAGLLFFVASESRARSTGYELPKHAKQVSDSVYRIGTARDPKTGKQIEGYAFVHRKDARVRPGNQAGAKGKVCYGFLAKGAEWKVTPEPWVVNAANNSNLSDNFVLSNLSADIAKWEGAAAADVLGSGSATTADLSLGANTLNDANEVYFDTMGDPSTIAVTVVWGIYSGPIAGRELVEWDQIYNTDYNWSDSGAAGLMDFENIATHELGHSFGMADLYTFGCSQETMYGYAAEGETNKRTLEAGDIAGINVLY